MNAASYNRNYWVFYAARALQYLSIGADLTVAGRAATEMSRPKTRGYFLGSVYFVQVFGGVVAISALFAATRYVKNPLTFQLFYATLVPFALIAIVLRFRMKENPLYLERQDFP